MNENHIPGALPVGCSERDMTRARIARAIPCIAKMDADSLDKLGLKFDAVQAVMAQAKQPAAEGGESGQPSMHGASTGVSLVGPRVVSGKAIKRFFDKLAPLDAFSTTYSDEYVLAGAPGELPELVVPVYDTIAGAEVDNYQAFSSRLSSAVVKGVKVELHKVDLVVPIYARDIEKGVNPETIMEAMASAISTDTLKIAFQGLAVGTEQFDDATAKITALEIPAIGNADGQFNFGFCNQDLSEAIQPRVQGMLLDSKHYGALKANNRDSLTASDLDMDAVYKVSDTDQLGTDAVGMIANKRGAAIGLAAPYMMKGAYATYDQLRKDGAPTSLAVATWFDADNNCVCIWMGTYIGVKVTDATAIKPLVPAAEPDTTAEGGENKAA